PLFGPSNPRDAVGRVGDLFFNVVNYFLNTYVLLGLNAVDIVNSRSRVIDEVRSAKGAALDYYAFVRNAYEQRREALVNDQPEAATSTEQQNLYYYEDEDHDNQNEK